MGRRNSDSAQHRAVIATGTSTRSQCPCHIFLRNFSNSGLLLRQSRDADDEVDEHQSWHLNGRLSQLDHRALLLRDAILFGV